MMSPQIPVTQVTNLYEFESLRYDSLDIEILRVLEKYGSMYLRSSMIARSLWDMFENNVDEVTVGQHIRRHIPGLVECISTHGGRRKKYRLIRKQNYVLSLLYQ